VVSRREYLFDAVFTVAVGVRADSHINIEQLTDAVKRPAYTPSLGRRSCPVTRPLYESTLDAADGKEALIGVAGSGLIYSEGASLANARPLEIRDVPMHSRHRQFGTRRIHVHADGGKD
jgi:CRISPR system Cascade subunit CasD